MIFAWPDRSTWAPILEVTRGRRSSAARIRDLLVTTYEGFTAYHGCRPQSVDSYYRDGIQSARIRGIDDEARRLFLSPRFPEVTPTELDRAISDVSTTFHDEVNAILDDRVLLELSGHYLIYGSERLGAIAARLTRPNSRDYQQALKEIGRPTIFEVSMPWSALNDATMNHFAKEVGGHLSNVRRRKEVPMLDFTVTVVHAIPPAWVRKHSYPTIIVDLMAGMTVYRPRTVID